MTFLKPPEDAVAQDQVGRQRDQALVCALLAAAISCVILAGGQNSQSPGVEEARQAVQQHRRLLTEHQKLLEEMDRVLLAHQQVVAGLQAARRGAPH